MKAVQDLAAKFVKMFSFSVSYIMEDKSVPCSDL